VSKDSALLVHLTRFEGKLNLTDTDNRFSIRDLYFTGHTLLVKLLILTGTRIVFISAL